MQGAPTTLTGQHRALDEAAAQLVAAWDVDIDSRTPAEGQEALERLKPPDSTSSFPPAPNTPTLPAIPPEGAGRNSGRTWAILGGGVALLALAGVALFGVNDSVDTSAGQATHGTVEEHSPAAPASAAPAPAAPAPAAPLPEPTVEPIPTEYSLTVRTIPKDARLVISNRRVPNPYKGKHPSDAPLHLEATAPGHELAVRELELTEDTHLMVTLVPEETASPKAEAAPPPKARQAKSKRRARKVRKRRAHKPRAKPRRGESKPSSAGFVSSNPYQ